MARPYKDWINIPDGSRFELSLTTVQGAGSGVADVTDDKGNTQEVKDGKIHPGPWSQPLVSPHFYTIIVTVALTGTEANELQVSATVFRPDGTQHGAGYRDSVAAKKEATGVILFTLETI